MTTPAVPVLWTVARDDLQAALRRPAVLLTAAFVLGVLWADAVAPPALPVAAICAVAVALTGLLALRLKSPALKLLLLTAFLFGAVLHAWRITPGAAAHFPAQGANLPRLYVTVRYTDWNPTAQEATVRWPSQEGIEAERGWIRLPAEPRLHAGDRVVLEDVQLWRPRPAGMPGERNMRRELAREGIHLQGRAGCIAQVQVGQPWRGPVEEWFEHRRERMLAVLEGAMPGTSPKVYAGLLAGMVIGMRSAEIPRNISDLFRSSGTIHLLVVSGAQVALIAFLLMTLVRGGNLTLPPWGAALMAVGLIAFAALVGMEVSVVRATIMAIVLLAAQHRGRRYDFLSALALSALLLALLNTGAIYRVGMQLSYACCLGIYLVLPRTPRPQSAWLGDLFRMAAWGTLGAWLFATPIIIWHFGNMVLFGILANLIAVPLAVGLLYLGVMALLGGLVWLPLAVPLCAVARSLLETMLASNRFFASLPLATVEPVHLSVPWLIVWYAAVLALAGLWRSPRLRQAARGTINGRVLSTATAGAGVALLVVAIVYTQPRPLQVHVLDVGPAQCVLVEAPGGNVLIDAGADPRPGRAETILRRRVLPFLALRRVRSLEAIIITHAHADHCNLAGPIMQDIPTRRLLVGDDMGAEADWTQMLQAAHDHGTQTSRFALGSSLRLGPQAWLTVVAPRRRVPTDDSVINDNSLVMRLMYRSIALLLPSDIGVAGERALLDDYRSQPDGLRADVLLAPHHGSAGSSSPAFLEAVKPAAIIVSCAGGRQGPRAEVLERYQRMGVSVWRTDQDGVVSMKTNGREFHVSGYRRSRR